MAMVYQSGIKRAHLPRGGRCGAAGLPIGGWAGRGNAGGCDRGPVPPSEDLGGAITGPLSAVTWGPNRLDIFGIAQSRSSHLWLVYC